MGEMTRRIRRQLVDNISDFLSSQSDPGFLPMAYGMELPNEQVGVPDSLQRTIFMMELRRGLLSVSDIDLIELAEDALENDKKSAPLLETARTQLDTEDS